MRAETLRTADGAELSITRLVGGEGGPPVVLLHGSYTDRRFWISRKGEGFARCLADHGFDVWIPEFRGHGRSPRPADYGRITADQFVFGDLPAIAAHLRSSGVTSALWVGHSSGGLSLAGALAMEALPQELVRGMVLVGVQAEAGHAWLRWPLVGAAAQWLCGALSTFPADRLGLGHQPAPGAATAQAIAWKRTGRWSTSDGRDFGAGLPRVGVPCLAVTSEGDRMDPAEGCRAFFERLGSRDKTLLVLGRAHGHRQDYDHPGMIVSRDAAAEVWPLLVAWLRAHAGAPRLP